MTEESLFDSLHITASVQQWKFNVEHAWLEHAYALKNKLS
jgi:hypothetical protein